MAKYCKWKINTKLSGNTEPPISTQIIANHNIVADYDKIPAEYLSEVKKMWLNVLGQSHSYAYRYGLVLLEAINGSYNANVIETAGPQAYSNQYLRVDRTVYNGGSYSLGQEGETTWYTWYAFDNHNGYYKNFIKGTLQKCHDDGNEISAVGFGWCYDMSMTNDCLGIKDPVYGCGWAGTSDDGPDGSKQWGLDSDDYAQTSNRVCLDTYLAATQEYIDYCIANSIGTKVFFTTGTVDSYIGENGYQAYLKNERIRNYVLADNSRILFDYADILCYDDNNVPTTTTWNGHTYPIITPTNLGYSDIGHIGSNGAIRLAKALWWMLARMCGWSGI
jgi:hypothetical protein